MGKTQIRRSNLKVQVKRFDLQKESIESELRDWNYGQKNFEIKSAWNQIVNCQNLVQVDYTETGARAEDFGIVSLDLDKRLRNGEGLKMRG